MLPCFTSLEFAFFPVTVEILFVLFAVDHRNVMVKAVKGQPLVEMYLIPAPLRQIVTPLVMHEPGTSQHNEQDHVYANYQPH